MRTSWVVGTLGLFSIACSDSEGGSLFTGGSGENNGASSANGGDAGADAAPSRGSDGGSANGTNGGSGANGGEAGSCDSSLDCADDARGRMICDPASSRCVECLSNADCDEGELCSARRCSSPCDSDRDCTPLGLLCDLDAGACVECLRDRDCDDGARCAAGACEAACEPASCSELGAECGTRVPDGCGGALECGSCDDGEHCTAEYVCSAEACPMPTGADVCTSLPRFPPVEQVVDGSAEEFCGVPSMSFRVAELPYTNPDPPPNLATTATLRAAWSPEALHVHVHVDDPVLMTSPSVFTLYEGDNVQIFVAPTSMLTGTFDGTDHAGADHIVVAPPAEGYPARADRPFNPGGTSPQHLPADEATYAARAVPGGYEVELRLEWSEQAEAIVAGAQIGFNAMIGVRDNADNPFDLEAALSNESVDGTETCDQPEAVLWCDTRTWCLTTLE